MCRGQALILVRVLGPWPRPTCEPGSVSLPSACHHLHLSSPITHLCKCHRMHSLSLFDPCFTNIRNTWYRINSKPLPWLSSFFDQQLHVWVHCTDMVGGRPLLTCCKNITRFTRTAMCSLRISNHSFCSQNHVSDYQFVALTVQIIQTSRR